MSPWKNRGWCLRPNYESLKTKHHGQPKRIKTVYGGGRKQAEKDIIKSIKNHFKLKNYAIKDRIIRVIKALFQQENDYYKPIRVGNFWNNNYIE